MSNSTETNTNDRSEKIEVLSYLLDNATLQDSLLQSYRSQHLSTQTILLAITTGLMFGITNTKTIKTTIALFLVQIAFTIFGIFMSYEMTKLIKNRGKDVDFWHHQILELEIRIKNKYRIPDRDYFCMFKEYQQIDRPSLDPKQYETELDKEIIRNVLEHMKGKTEVTHTRNVLDMNISKYMRWLYLFMLLPPAIIILLINS